MQEEPALMEEVGDMHVRDLREEDLRKENSHKSETAKFQLRADLRSSSGSRRVRQSGMSRPYAQPELWFRLSSLAATRVAADL
jgi:hypothetical protein